jgi:hypothetical protein
MAKAQELLYAVVGAGDYAVDKVKNVRKVADRKVNQKLYRDFIKRGRTVSTKVKNAKPTKQIAAQTEPVRTKAEDAFKSVSKALGVNVVSWPKRPASRKSTPKRSTPKKSTAKKTTRKTTAAKAS